MPLVTLKTRRPLALAANDSFLRHIRRQTLSILASQGDRVLVVFGEKDATISYERHSTPHAKPG